MSIQDQVFIDGVGEVRLVDGVIRMDLVSLSARRRSADGGQPPEFVAQLVMSAPAFMRMIASLSSTVKSLQERGMIKVREEDAAGANENGDVSEAASPNFG